MASGASTQTFFPSANQAEKGGQHEGQFIAGNSVHNATVAIRLGFLRKVYGILAMQITLTTFVCAAFMIHEPLAAYVKQSQGLVMVSGFAAFGLLLALLVHRHNHPTNLYILFAFTLLESLSVGTIVTFYQVSSVLKAASLTATIMIALTLYTMQSTRDFSTWGACLFASLWILIGSVFLQAIFPSKEMELVLSIGGAMLFCGFIIFDTHMIMHNLSPEEYILASINLYLDILNLFIYLLRIFGERK